jgi:hypothetical protein
MGKVRPILFDVGSSLVALIIFWYLAKPAFDKAFKKDPSGASATT